MTATEPKVDPRGLYGVTEAAKALGVNVSTITRAANRLDGDRALKFTIRRSTGRRVYRGQDIINYWRLVY